MKIDVLGTEYDILQQSDKENKKLKDADGISELYSKKIVLRTGYESDSENFEEIEKYKGKVLRHELYHVVFHECGLTDYCRDEKLVEFLAIMHEKINAIIVKAELEFENADQ